MADRRAPLAWLKPGLFVGALVPLAALLWGAAHRALGPDAVAVGLNQLGYLALVFLVLSLTPTPLKLVFGWTWPVRLRRMLGLFAAFYASLHLTTYVALDQQFDWQVLWEDVTQRKFIAVGLLAFLLLVPLALTSTDASLRRLGFVRWKRLHRLAYVSVVLAVVHFIWRVKKDVTVPAVWAGVVAVLLFLRVAEALRKRKKRSVAARTSHVARE